MILNHIRVLDLSRLLPGPYCTMMLADFGAEVIKIEDPNQGDYLRDFDPKVDENSAVFHSLNRNKKSVVLNLKDEADKQSFLSLVETADVIVESFRPGVMKRLGLDYETLKSVNPGLIYCAISGYGQNGPRQQEPGHDVNYLGYAGLLQLMGDKERKPIVPSTQIADIGGGAYPAAVGILLSIIEREKTGEGQFVDISMLDGVVSWLHMMLPNHVAGYSPKRGSELLNGGYACYQVYETHDGKYLALGAVEAKFWKAFCEGIDREHFVPLQHASLDVQDEMIAEIEMIMKQQSQSEWLKAFEQLEACLTPVHTFDEMLENPQLREREMIQASESGLKQMIENPIKLSNNQNRLFSQPPKHGEHTEEIIRELTKSNKL
uniref:CaiB/BaiF CoA transferase family protein n=1 Tax=uncultured Allobacillus sp. TaxID=1638025 RepID=UPI002592C71C|nr:CaiB/BaiF CoA-transferase family protein [uncultured Allobacillus sp.]